MRGAGGGVGGAGGSTTGFAGTAFGGIAAGFNSILGASGFVSTGGGATGGFAAGRAGSAASFCFCVMARSTSPGREMCERSILVLKSSSPWAAREAGLDEEPDEASERPRRCLRTRSASCSSSELECVFFSVTPTAGRTSRISRLLTSNSRARSLIRTLLINSRYQISGVVSGKAKPENSNPLPRTC
jgi:hypothetical protein